MSEKRQKPDFHIASNFLIQQRAMFLQNVALAIGEVVEAIGSVPSGHLYARVMDRLTLEDYDAALDILVMAGKVRRDESHLLTWVG